MRLELLLAQLLAILAASRLAGAAMRPLGQPRVIGEIVAGLALGPSLLGALAPTAQGALFPADAMAPLATISQLGVLLFMFTVGLRLDLGLVRAKAGAAVVVSQASILAPFALGALIAPLLHPHLAGPGPDGGGTGLLPFTLFLGAAMSVTAFPVLARILADRGLVGTRLGTLAIACAAVDDATAWLMLAAVVGVARAGDGWWHLASTLGATVLVVGVLLTAGRAALGWAAQQQRPDDTESLPSAIAPAIGVALAAALMTEWAGIHALFGAFLAGVLVPRADGLASAMADRIEPVVASVFLPVFFAFTGVRTDIGLVSGAAAWGTCAAIITVAVTGKLAGSALAARATGLGWREATALGVLMNTRGLMELVVLNVGLELGVISPTLFTMMVLMALVTTAMTSPLLAWLGTGTAPRTAAPAAAAG